MIVTDDNPEQQLAFYTLPQAAKRTRAYRGEETPPQWGERQASHPERHRVIWEGESFSTVGEVRYHPERRRVTCEGESFFTVGGMPHSTLSGVA